MTEHPAEHANPGADTVPVLAKQMMNYAYDFDTAWDEMPELHPQFLLYAKAAHELFADVVASDGGRIFTLIEMADLRTVLWGEAGDLGARDRLRKQVPPSVAESSGVTIEHDAAAAAVAVRTEPYCQHDWVHTDINFPVQDGSVRGPFDGQRCTACSAIKYGGSVFMLDGSPEAKSCTGGRPFAWSAFGAPYRDTTCIDGMCGDLDWDGSVAAGITCPFCDPAGFFEYQFGGNYVEPTCATCLRRGIDPAAITFHDGEALTWSVMCPTCCSDQPALMRDYEPGLSGGEQAELASL